MTDWKLEDVEAAARQKPGSFFIPSEMERHTQKVGDEVRLHFLLTPPSSDRPRAERMWVEITAVQPGGCKYTGTLESQPVHIAGLNAGDIIQFAPRHIARIIIRKHDPRWIECGEQMALVSALVFEGDNGVRFAYREKPDREEDSGWRLFSGHEPDEYSTDPAHVRICNVYWLADFDPSLAEILRCGLGSVFERSTRDSQWKKVEDWAPSEE